MASPIYPQEAFKFHHSPARGESRLFAPNKKKSTTFRSAKHTRAHTQKEKRSLKEPKQKTKQKKKKTQTKKKNKKGNTVEEEEEEGKKQTNKKRKRSVRGLSKQIFLHSNSNQRHSSPAERCGSVERSPLLGVGASNFFWEGEVSKSFSGRPNPWGSGVKGRLSLGASGNPFWILKIFLHGKRGDSCGNWGACSNWGPSDIPETYGNHQKRFLDPSEMEVGASKNVVFLLVSLSCHPKKGVAPQHDAPREQEQRDGSSTAESRWILAVVPTTAHVGEITLAPVQVLVPAKRPLREGKRVNAQCGATPYPAVSMLGEKKNMAAHWGCFFLRASLRGPSGNSKKTVGCNWVRL